MTMLAMHDAHEQVPVRPFSVDSNWDLYGGQLVLKESGKTIVQAELQEVVNAIEALLGEGSIRSLPGLFRYARGGHREWHNNRFSGTPGWNAYLVLVDQQSGSNDTSWFALREPSSGLVHRFVEQTGQLNMFQLTMCHKDLHSCPGAVWHTIYTDSKVVRTSLGMQLETKAASTLQQILGLQHNRKVQPSVLQDDL